MPARIDAQDRRTLAMAAGMVLAGTAGAWFFFSAHLGRLSADVEVKGLALQKAKDLLSRKEAVSSAYSRLRAAGGADSMAAWMGRLSEMGKKEGIFFDGITPQPVDSRAPERRELGVVLKFRTDFGRFSGFLHAVSGDPLCLAEAFRVEKAPDGTLDCEITLRKVLA